MNLTVPDADDGPILNVGCFDILGAWSASTFEKVDYFGFVLPNRLQIISCKLNNRNQSELRWRASSRARIANLRRDSARRSYRSMASNFLVSCDRIVANLYGPCGVEFTIRSTVASDRSGAFFCRRRPKRATFFRMFARIHNKGRPMCGTAIDGGHFARGANRSLRRRIGAPAVGFACWRAGRRSPVQAFPPLRIMLD